MQLSAKDAWKRILDEAHRELPDHTIRTWLEPTEAIVMPRRPGSRLWVLSAGAASVAALVVAVATTGLPGWGLGGVRTASRSNAAQLRAAYADQERGRLLLQHAASPAASSGTPSLARALRTPPTGRSAAK
jgi:hypothetical protein